MIGTAIVGAAGLGFLGYETGELINNQLEIVNDTARITVNAGTVAAGATTGYVTGTITGLFASVLGPIFAIETIQRASDFFHQTQRKNKSNLEEL